MSILAAVNLCISFELGKMKLFVIILLFALSLVHAQNASQPFSCYVCDSSIKEECRTNTDSPEIACHTLQYDPTQTSPTRRLATIFKRQSPAFGLPVNTQFNCIKAYVKENGIEHLVRSCVPVTAAIADVCDYLRNELDSNFALGKCYSCTTNLCNEGVPTFNTHGVKFVILFTSSLYFSKLLF